MYAFCISLKYFYICILFFLVISGIFKNFTFKLFIDSIVVYKLILYIATALLSSFILIVSQWIPMDFLCTRLCHLQVQMVLLLFQFGCFLFLLPNCLGSVFSTLLNRSSNNGLVCLVPNITRKAFSLSPLSIKLTVDFSVVFLRTKLFLFFFCATGD